MVNCTVYGALYIFWCTEQFMYTLITLYVYCALYSFWRTVQVLSHFTVYSALYSYGEQYSLQGTHNHRFLFYFKRTRSYINLQCNVMFFTLFSVQRDLQAKAKQ